VSLARNLPSNCCIIIAPTAPAIAATAKPSDGINLSKIDTLAGTGEVGNCESGLMYDLVQQYCLQGRRICRCRWQMINNYRISRPVPYSGSHGRLPVILFPSKTTCPLTMTDEKPSEY